MEPPLQALGFHPHFTHEDMEGPQLVGGRARIQAQSLFLVMSTRLTSDSNKLGEACSTDLWHVACGKLPGHARLLCLPSPPQLQQATAPHHHSTVLCRGYPFTEACLYALPPRSLSDVLAGRRTLH